MHIREVRVNDLDALASLAEQVWCAHYPGILSREQIVYMLKLMYAPHRLQRSLRAPQKDWWGLDMNGALVAYGEGELQGRRSYYLHKLYLHPDLHGRGYGRKLLEHGKVLAEKRGAECLRLHVNRYNVRALRAYRHYGFVHEAEECREIGRGYVMDDYRMCYTIHGEVKSPS